MLEDRDFEFPKRESKLDRVRVEWKNLTNDKEKRRYCDELEEVIQDLEDELDLRNKVIDKLDKTRKKLGGYLVCSIIILILSCWGIYVSNN
jgi:predicted RNase H-like nuclease (RuvC/YqgF family)|tara:strand:- start:392 stop:664 length:273 start_codon:yes stop_codon:yes gene_type:complete